MQKTAIALLALALAGFATSAGAQTVVSGEITTDTQWSGEIVMDGAVFVKNEATLTIVAGTVVRGQPRTASVTPGETAGTPGVLIITQQGRINADGAATNPIIFTTAAVDNDNDGVPDDDDNDGFFDAWQPGDTFYDDDPLTAPLAPLNANGDSNVSLWGGVVVLGDAPTNLADKGGLDYGRATVEGLTVPGFDEEDAAYGGNLAHDNSGIIRYVSIRHGGDELGSGNELNGLTLAGVGDGTKLENVEIYCTFDDGIEWFGGTVNGKNLAVFFVGDDHFDMDQGYDGTNQFLLAIMPFFDENDGDSFGSASGDKAAELDGDDYRPDNANLNDNVNVRRRIDDLSADDEVEQWSNFGLWNMTVIGSTPDSGQEFTPQSPARDNRGVQIRNGGNGFVHNSIVVNTGGRAGLEIDTGIGDGAPGFDSCDNVNARTTRMASSTLDDGEAPSSDDCAAGEALANGDAYNADINSGTANVVNGAFNGLENEDQTFDPQGDASGKLSASLKASKIDPRPAPGLTGTLGGITPVGPSLDEAATYRGGFNRTASRLWTTGWTALNLGGILED